MCTTRGRAKLLFATYAFLICVIHHSCTAQVQLNTNQDCTSSCGNIHNITYPFRLNTDPKHCGTKDYQLSCENNVLTLYFNLSGGRIYGYPVQAINYNNLTVRLWDPTVHLDNCCLPVANRSKYDNLDYYLFISNYSEWFTTGYSPWYITSTGYYDRTLRELILISCEYPMSVGSVFEVYNSPCNFTRHWYLKLRNTSYFDDDYLFQMGNSCRVEARAITSLLRSTVKNMSYVDVNNYFDYGFELSWQTACWYTLEVSTKYNCSIRIC